MSTRIVRLPFDGHASLTAHEPPVRADAVPWHPLDDPGPTEGWLYEARSDEWVRYSAGTVIARIAAEAFDVVAHVVDLPDELSPRPHYTAVSPA